MKSKKIIHSILSENAIDAKKLIQEDLAIKLGERLAEEYVRVAKLSFADGEEGEEGESTPATPRQNPKQTPTGFDVRLAYND